MTGRRMEQRAVGSHHREHKHGQEHHSARYPDSLVDTIRGLYRLGEHGYTKLATMFGVPRSTVRKWIKFQIREWKAVGGNKEGGRVEQPD